MIDKQTVAFEDLLGEHWLTGVDMDIIPLNEEEYQYEDARSISFRLDGKVYTAVEDPSDGYRSNMAELFVSDTKIKNKFPKVRVEAKLRLDDDWGRNDVLDFYDVKTGDVVLSVGTENTDDYYPYFVGSFNPEGMSINTKVKK